METKSGLPQDRQPNEESEVVGKRVRRWRLYAGETRDASTDDYFPVSVSLLGCLPEERVTRRSYPVAECPTLLL